MADGMGNDGKDFMSFIKMVDHMRPFHETDIRVRKEPREWDRCVGCLVLFLDFPFLLPQLYEFVDIGGCIQLIREHDGHHVVFEVRVIKGIDGVLLLLFFPDKHIIEVNALFWKDTGKFMEDHETGVENLQRQRQP